MLFGFLPIVVNNRFERVQNALLKQAPSDYITKRAADGALYVCLSTARPCETLFRVVRFRHRAERTELERRLCGSSVNGIQAGHEVVCAAPKREASQAA